MTANFNGNGNSVGRGCGGLKPETARIRQRQLRKLCELQPRRQDFAVGLAVYKAFALAVAASVPFPVASVASASNAVAVAVAVSAAKSPRLDTSRRRRSAGTYLAIVDPRSYLGHDGTTATRNPES